MEVKTYSALCDDDCKYVGRRVVVELVVVEGSQTMMIYEG